MVEVINNITSTLKEDLQKSIKRGDKISIASACFSIYAFQELKEQLKSIDSLRFIFTSPTFVKEHAPRERKQFYSVRDLIDILNEDQENKMPALISELEYTSARRMV